MEKNIKEIETPSCTFQEMSKEIDLVQSSINRMAKDQLQMKIFCVSIIAFIITFTFIIPFIKFLSPKSNEVGSTTPLIWSLFAKSNEVGSTTHILLFILFILFIFIVVIESFRALDRHFLRIDKIYTRWYNYIVEIRETNRENLFLLDPIKMQEILVMHNRIDITTLSTKQSSAFFRIMYCVVFVFLLLCCLLIF